MISCHCSFSKSPSRAVCSPVTATQVLANQSGRVDWVATTPSRVSASSGVGTYRPATISFYVRSLLIPEVASSMMRAALRWSDPPSVSSRGASDARLCLGGWGGGVRISASHRPSWPTFSVASSFPSGQIAFDDATSVTGSFVTWVANVTVSPGAGYLNRFIVS